MVVMGKKDAVKPPKLSKEAYEAELKRLQAELVEMQQWVVETGARVVIIMEGRDAAGKGSAIKRITQYLNPRTCRIEALPAPNSREQGQWYFQRYVEKLPTAGEIVIFDRSWYNRGGVERVMGFCTSQEYRRFLHQAPIFERLLVEDGILLRKYWFSVSDEEQVKRFKSRLNDPLRRWKLSPMDLQSITRWEDYSRAKDEMFIHTDIPSAPWYTVESEDKKRSRINVINHLLSSIPYEKIERPLPEIPDRPESTNDYVRPPRSDFRYVPDVAAKLEAERIEEETKAKKPKKKKK
ncbi:polyphosphate kinase 2 [Corynebacterium sp. H128]|uniref:polyphosphate kinase 2 n=1 Tax=Corynebacterium sp. H128 TaxID=3133427 RepID=UPI00403F9058